MNDIAKAATVDKFSRAIQAEGLGKAEAGAFIGLMPAQVSYLFNEKYWPRLGNVGWDMLLKWGNSGQSLKEYSEKHGKVLPEIPQRHELPPKAVKVQPVKENTMKPEDVGVKKIVVEKSDKGIKIEGADVYEDSLPIRSKKIKNKSGKYRGDKIEIRPGWFVNKGTLLSDMIISAKEDNQQHQKISIDIEINLVINGKKITL